MKIVRSPTDGWYVLQESLDHRGSTVEGERSEDGHVMLLPEIEFDDDLPVQAEDPILLEMDQFLANANDDQDLQDGTASRPDDYYPDSNLFSLFNESDFNSDNDQSDREKSPLYSTTNRSIFDGKPLVNLTANFGTSQTVDDDVSPESIRNDQQLVANTSSSSGSDSSSPDSSYTPSSDSSSSESDSDSEYSFDSSVESSSCSDSSSTLVQKLTTRQRKRFVETAEQREGRLRKRRERERQRRAAMTQEELAKFREKKRASERASKLKLRLKKAAELQKGLGPKDSGFKDSGLKTSGPKPKRLVAQVPAEKLNKNQQVVQQNTNRKKPRAQMSPEELEMLRKAQRDEKRNRLARMTEQERQAHRERIREYDRMWREKNREKKAEYSRKNASSSKLPKNGKLSPQQKKNQKQKSLMSKEELEMKRKAQRDKKRNRLARMTEQERQKHRARVREYDRLWREKKKSEYQKQQNGATVDLFEARRQRKNAQTRMRRRAKLASETPEQREERLRKRREQVRNRKQQAEVGQPEVENHFRQMASMITSKQLTEHRNRKRKHRSGGHDPDYRPKLGDVHKRRQRPSIVDYSDSDD